MKDIEKLFLSPSASISEALQVINENTHQIALVINEQGQLLGSITDGDIRRGLLRGVALEANVKQVLHENPIVAHHKDTNPELIKLALEKKIRQIPIVDHENRVVGLKEIEQLIRPEIKPNKVVLMVGGLGTRLYPLTENTPKPLLKVGEKPILQTIVETFASYGFVNFIFCVNYKSEMICDYFGDGSKFGVNIEYVHEDKRMGTAGALSLIKERPHDPFFVMNGDLLTNVNYESILDFHNQHHACLTMCVREYDFQVPYGVVTVENERIISIDEKPVHSFFVSAGIYILDPKALDLIPPEEFFDMPTLFEQMIQADCRAVSFPIHEYWLDIGRIQEYELAQTEYTKYFLHDK